jgi:hypothetical protein
MRYLLLFFLLLVAGTATAEDFVCGDTTQLQRYSHAVDPTRVPTCPAPFLLSQIPEAAIPAQRALYTNPAIPHRHLKVVEGLMVEMTPEEKQAVDAPLVAEAALVQQAKDELASQEYCSTKTLSQVTTKVTNKTNQIHANVDAITNLQTGKDADRANFDIVMALIDQLARCVLAARTSR